MNSIPAAPAAPTAYSHRSSFGYFSRIGRRLGKIRQRWRMSGGYMQATASSRYIVLKVAKGETTMPRALLCS